MEKSEAIASHFTFSDWENDPPSLWTSPSSPPYNEPTSRINSSLSVNRRIDQSSSPSTPSEFEFDLLATPEVRDEPPVSPKFVSSFATEYWAEMASNLPQERDGNSTHTSSLHSNTVFSIDRVHTSSSSHGDIVSLMDRPDANTPTGTTTLSQSRKQVPCTPSSSSVRQLIIEEMHGEHDNEQDLDFYSAPQTPAARSRPHTPKQRPLSIDYEPYGHDKQQGSHIMAPWVGQRKSKSVVLDGGRSEIATASITGLTPSKSESHGSFIGSSSSAMNAWDKIEEEEKNAAAKKAGSSKSFKKWVFKDLLRRTVPSSKADAHYITKTLGAPSPSRSLLSNPRSTPISPQSSPLRSYLDSTSRPPMLQAVRPSSSRAPRSPPHRRPSTPGRSPLDTHLEVHTTSNRTPAPSPPHSPMSPHVTHYKLQKAQAQELGRKTFLPYRQSLLGCLGGSSAFSSDQLVW